MVDQRISSVVILGGGTSGWMAACYLAKALPEGTSITVLEAPTIPRIGVGEATIPNLQRAFFAHVGLAEDDWMRECNASFKMGIKFINWCTPGEGVAAARPFGSRTDHYYHIFGLLPDNDQYPLSHYWVHKRHHGQTDEAFDYACYKEPPVLDAKLAPRWPDGRRWASYAWHFDAQQVADFLCRFGTTQLGIQRVEDEMSEVQLDNRRFITALKTKGGRTLPADLFVDCSGFRGALINQAMREPFLDMSESLLCDRAVATQIPHDDAANGVEAYTSAIAMKAGWSWKIPMLTRFGTGYVYSSRFVSDDEATEDLCRMWGLDSTTTRFNRVRFRVGRNRRSWVNNCVSIGLASCFLEPLESTGLYFTYAALYQLVKHFPDRRFDPILIDRFNREVETMFDDSRDFLQAHFYLSPRNDTPFWAANKHLELGEDIREKIDMYRAGLPINPPITDESTYYGNLEAEFRNFWNNSNYYCIFAGLGLLPDHPLPILAHRPAAVRNAEAIFQRIKQQQRELTEALPTHYELLCHLHGRELAPVAEVGDASPNGGR